MIGSPFPDYDVHAASTAIPQQSENCMTIKTKIARPMSSVPSPTWNKDVLNMFRAQLPLKEFYDVLLEGLSIAAQHNATDEDLNNLFDVVRRQGCVVVEGLPVSVQVEKLTVNRDLRMPAYNYKGPGSVMTMGHLWPHRHLVVNKSVGELAYKVVMEAVSHASNPKCAERLVDAYLRFISQKDVLETIRFDGPWDALE